MSPWTVSTKFDRVGAALADRHYSRRTPGSPQFAPPGRVLVLIARTLFGDAVWVTREEARERTTHAWPGAWQVTIFRNESAHRSSNLIRAAVAATLEAWGGAPPEGFLTFVDPKKIRSTNPGCCFKAAGWKLLGTTLGGHGRNPLLAFGFGAA